ncbi:hypothetical protein KM043_000644 [Ampulex compressa]|nr:hypothetical protein KM043_000644 [Ampulex compressa]
MLFGGWVGARARIPARGTVHMCPAAGPSTAAKPAPPHSLLALPTWELRLYSPANLAYRSTASARPPGASDYLPPSYRSFHHDLFIDAPSKKFGFPF